MIFQKITITATPDQVEKKWDNLTDYQKSQVTLARALHKSLQVEIIDRIEDRILYNLGVIF